MTLKWIPPNSNSKEVSFGAYTEQRVVTDSFISKMGSKDTEEPDGWLSYPQMFNALVLIMEPNGCLVGANSTRFTCTFVPAAHASPPSQHFEECGHMPYGLHKYSRMYKHVYMHIHSVHTNHLTVTIAEGDSIFHHWHLFILTAQRQMTQIICTPCGAVLHCAGQPKLMAVQNLYTSSRSIYV